MNAGADDGCGNSGGEVAVADKADARSGFANVFDDFFVAGAVENDDDEVFDVAIEALGDGFEIVGDRSVEIHGAFAARADDDFFHVEIGGVKEAAAFAGGKNGDGVCGPGGAEIRAFKRVYGDVYGWKICVGGVRGETDFFADVEHGRFIAFAFADDDGAVHLE